jgi:CBS domain-containing protein
MGHTSRLKLEGVRELRAPLAPGWSLAPEPLACGELACQKGGDRRRTGDCVYCPRFLGWREEPGSGEVTVTCRWTGDDPASALMTCLREIVEVTPGTSLQAAEELATHAGVRHLVVLRRGRLVGVLCRCDLVAPHAGDETVASRMRHPVTTVGASTTLAEALETMNRDHIGCVPVVECGLLLGILTRGDLRRAGFPEEALGADRCAACGSYHGVTSTERSGAAEFCIECFERARPASDDELGDGD